ncbi:helix-turn-helix domain-containing protein [Paenibacillus sp. MBLB4367]|uniref:helix-turn-helix domain-containing protein n=1 Tax=Paenibacillus sp. MBLB4367 TaxID=3384767 RepID=UPI003908289B
MFKLPALPRNRSSVFTKFFVSYIIVFTVPFMILGVIIYALTFDIVKTQTEKTYLNAVHDAAKNVDAKIAALHVLTAHISELQWVQKIMYMRGTTADYMAANPLAFQYHMNDLTTLKGINGFISDLAIFFREQDLILSSQGKHNLASFFEDAFYYDGLTADYWSDLLAERSFAEIRNPAKVLTYKQSRSLLTYVQSLPMVAKDFKATFLAFIDEHTLQDSLNISTITNNGSLSIIDKDGRFITGVNVDEAMKTFLTSQHPSLSAGRIANLAAPGGDDLIVIRSDSTVNGWSYIAAVPLNTAMAKVNQIKTITLWITVLSVLAGLVLSYILALRNYTPLANILKEISPRLLNLPNASKRPNEFNFLQKAFHAMLDYENKTKEDIEIYKPLVRNSLFIQLLEGKPVPAGSKLLETMEMMEITYNNSFFTCASLILDAGHTIPEAVQQDIIVRLSGQKNAVYFVDIGGKHKVIVISSAYKEQITPSIEEIVCAFKNAGIVCKAIGVGKACKGLDELRSSYREANAALDYRFIRGNSSVIFYEEIEDAFTLPAYYYRTEKEDHLVNFIRVGDYGEAIKLFRDIVDTHISNASLPPAAARNLFFNMAACALKALEDLNIDNQQAFHMDEFLHLETHSEMTGFIEELYRHACEIVIRKKESKNTDLRDEVLTYIHEHLTDRNLTLTSLADQFGSSLSYLSRFIKNQTGTNFVDYLNKRRIELSKTLLADDLTVREVALQVGFDNDLTFRRLFKKYEGINPGEYKNMSGGKR